jgi:Na+/melibiose symporter-like transporter
MIGYGASAQVMVFFLPLFLQNAYGYEPVIAGVTTLPFALPMVLAPRLTAILATRFSGRTLLTEGLAITAVGNFLFWVVVHAQLSYSVFVAGMLVAGAGAGLLNGQTVKVLESAMPPDRPAWHRGLPAPGLSASWSASPVWARCSRMSYFTPSERRQWQRVWTKPPRSRRRSVSRRAIWLACS